MEKITELLSAKVMTEDGVYVGRVMDVRSEGEPEHGLVNESRPITELLYGKTGPLSFLGWRSSEVKSVAWKDIKKLSPGKVVIMTKEDN